MIATKRVDFSGSNRIGRRRTAASQLDWRYRAIYEFLQISPSYWLAHMAARDELTESTPVPKDFALVQRTYEAFGSVWLKSFHSWWFDVAQYQFAVERSPQVHVIGQVKAREALSDEAKARFVAQMEDALDAQRDVDGLPQTIVLSIPLHGTRRDVQRAITAAIEGLDFQAVASGNYRLLRTKAREDAVLKALRVVRARAARPKTPIWKVAGLLNLNGERSRLGSVDDKHVLSAHTSRYTKRAYVLAENAARGSFPDESKLPDDIAIQEFDFALLNRLYRAEIKFLEAEIKALRASGSRKSKLA